MKLFFLSAWALFFPLFAAAQRYHPTAIYSREALAVSSGTTAFYGDVQGSGSRLGRGLHLGLSYEYKALPLLGLRLSGLWYQLEASDDASPSQALRDRNLSFKASNWELSLMTALYLRPQQPLGFKSRSRFNAYGLLGVGATYYTPEAEYAGKAWDLRSRRTEGVRYNKTTLVIPFGAGLQYRISSLFDLGLQLTYHYTFSDYLDDVSTRYQAADSFSDPVAAILADRRPEIGLEAVAGGTVRGNPGVKDSYSMLSLRLQYHLMRYHYRGREVKKLYQ